MRIFSLLSVRRFCWRYKDNEDDTSALTDQDVVNTALSPRGIDAPPARNHELVPYDKDVVGTALSPYVIDAWGRRKPTCPAGV